METVFNNFKSPGLNKNHMIILQCTITSKLRFSRVNESAVIFAIVFFIDIYKILQKFCANL